ncbi:MAG: GNAT family N-acetyltransferase [Alphaproteobacteria bacterium]
MAQAISRDRLRVESFTGEAARRHIPALAALRIEVFRDFPYLYDGSLAYEETYLRTYTESPDSVIAIAFDRDSVIGAATGLPLAHEPANVTASFKGKGYDTARIFYCGESVLKRAYRGQGLGVAFFEHREAWARRLGRFREIAFCAVVRAADHPRRPPDYVPLDSFWRKRGYAPVEGLECTMTWRDLDEREETAKRMQFWMKDLAS